MDLLFGLDMLKAHQACIDLEHDVLRIKGRTVKFLPEHELPDNARADHSNARTEENNPTVSAPTPPDQSAHARFPGAGNALGGAPSSLPSRATPVGASGGGSGREEVQQQLQQPRRLQYAEKDIQTIMSMGVSREMAIETLDVAQGNVDLAASLLF